jgi:hypothetical protein
VILDCETAGYVDRREGERAPDAHESAGHHMIVMLILGIDMPSDSACADSICGTVERPVYFAGAFSFMKQH